MTAKIDFLGLTNFNLEIKAGEIVAITGVESNSQNELINTLTGLSKAAIIGKIWLAGQEITNFSAKKLRV